MAVPTVITTPVTVQSATCTRAFHSMALPPTFQAGHTHNSTFK